MKRRLLLFGYPLAEILTAMAVAAQIGWTWTLVLLAIGIPIGWSITKRAGARILSEMQQTLTRGTLPPQGLSVLAGLLITIPGFLTDILGGVLLIPGVQRSVSTRWRLPGTGTVVQGVVIVHEESGGGPAEAEPPPLGSS
jgi:UPF0716 protein FxsA